MDIYYATTNRGKLESLQRRLDGCGVVVVQAPMDIPEPRAEDVRDIAVAKVQYAYERLQKPVVALDAGFYIPSLNGFPKAYVNFVLETIGLEGILGLVEEKQRDCEFRECLAYMESPSEPVCFPASIKGVLADKPRGALQPHLWSKLGLIFIPCGHDKTLAELTHSEYVHWSHDSKDKESASRQFATWLEERVR